MNADLVERLFILGVDVGSEDQFGVGRAMQPAVFLDLGFELSRSPAGIAEREHGAERALAPGDRLQDIERRRETDAFVDRQRRILDEKITGVQHKSAPGFYRTTL